MPHRGRDATRSGNQTWHRTGGCKEVPRRGGQTWVAQAPSAARAPRGLTPPPGLERVEGPADWACDAVPPGLRHDAAAPSPLAPPSKETKPPRAAPSSSVPGHTVEIAGLPNAMMIEPAMEAMLEQASLEGQILSIDVRPSRPCGEATIVLKTRGAAERCVRHFDGRRWDPSGVVVSARALLGDSASIVDATAAQPLHAEAAPSPGGLAGVGQTLSAAAAGPLPLAMPAYVPMTWLADENPWDARSLFASGKVAILASPKAVNRASSSDGSTQVSDSETVE